MTMLAMRNVVQNYAWGSTTMLQTIRGNGEPAAVPEAELWMGSHPRGPSRLVLGDGTEKEIAPNSIPFLFKILTAEKGLSIQAHPHKTAAEEGYARENEAGIPLHAPQRNYRDTNHKPELVCALTDFWGLRGFRPVSAISSELERVIAHTVGVPDEFKRLIGDLYDEPTVHLWRRVFLNLLKVREDATLCRALCAGAAEYAGSRDGRDRDDPYWWVLELQRQFPDDPGTLAPLYLNLVRLRPGQAMYLDAGTLHAYLYGAAVEIMANSDNVLRAGCTEKHVDIAEIGRILVFDRKETVVIKPDIKPDKEQPLWTYHTPAGEFELHRVVLPAEGSVRLVHKRGPVVVLAVGGAVGLSSGDQSLTVQPGHSAFLQLYRPDKPETVELAVVGEAAVGEAADHIVFVAALPGAIVSEDR